MRSKLMLLTITTERKEPSFMITIPSRTSAICRVFWVLLGLVLDLTFGSLAVAGGETAATPPTGTGGATGGG
jgi:hypothetical protein